MYCNSSIPLITYHSAAIVKVMLVFVSMGTEIHACSDSRKWPTFLQTQPTVWSNVLIYTLSNTHTHTHTHTQKNQFVFYLFL